MKIVACKDHSKSGECTQMLSEFFGNACPGICEEYERDNNLPYKDMEDYRKKRIFPLRVFDWVYCRLCLFFGWVNYRKPDGVCNSCPLLFIFNEKD